MPKKKNPDSKVALITGVNGQCGPFLAAELLSTNEYDIVYGMYRSPSNSSVLSPVASSNFVMIEGDLTDNKSLEDVLEHTQPDEIYNLGGFSHIGKSFHQPKLVLQTNGDSVICILEYMSKHLKKSKFCQASSYEVFAGGGQMPVNESSQIAPVSPYSISKVLADQFIKLYRNSYGIFACSAYLGNTESWRRGDNFVTKKITNWINSVIDGEKTVLKLGYLDAKRDWGMPGNYMAAMRLILQQNQPDDFMLCTGILHSVREFLELACKIGLNKTIVWKDQGISEKGYIDGQLFIEVDANLYRPADVPVLYGDPSKAIDKLNWNPNKNFEQLISEMLNGVRIIP